MGGEATCDCECIDEGAGGQSAVGLSDLASSSSGAEKKKRRALKRPRLSTKQKLARKEEVNLRMRVALSLETDRVDGFDVSPPEAPAKPVDSRTVDFASVGSSEGIPITTERRHTFAESPLLPKGSVGSLLLEGTPQVIIIKEEGDPASTSTFMRERKPLYALGSLPKPSKSLLLAKMTRRFSGAHSTWRGMRVARRRGSWSGRAKAAELLSHVWKELYDLERRIRSIDGCSSQV
ncbi:hypothetical protein ACLOJK_005576 [Asimina triloba]